jgi:hypothetical protein
MGSCAGFTGDEELVQRYLGMRRHRTHSNES